MWSFKELSRAAYQLQARLAVDVLARQAKAQEALAAAQHAHALAMTEAKARDAAKARYRASFGSGPLPPMGWVQGGRCYMLVPHGQTVQVIDSPARKLPHLEAHSRTVSGEAAA